MTRTWNPSPNEDSFFLAPSVVLGGAASAGGTGEALRKRIGLAPGETVLLAVDDIVKTVGLIDPIEQSLIDAGYQVAVHGGFGAEPAAEVLDPIIEEARRIRARAVVGVGGGSVLDSSKLIALMLNNPGSCADWLGVVTPENGVAPMVLIPTTCGTGSEATRVAMVTVGGAKQASLCDSYVPPVAILDPIMVSSLPKQVIAATGMDALAHATEALMSTSASILSATSSLRAIELLIEHLEAAYNGDSDSLAYVLWASHIAGQALNAGVVLGHSLAYCLTNAKPMPHGVSCAIALPYCIAYNQNLEPALGRRLALALTGGESDKLRSAAEHVREMARRMGLPTTLGEASISREAVPEMAALCVGSYPRPTNPEAFDEALLAQLFEALETGDLDRAFSVTKR